MILEILKYPAEKVFLTQECKYPPVATDEFVSFCDDLRATMEHYKGAGLAAPQVGRQWNVFVLASIKEVIVCPKITWRSRDKEHGMEGCLSMPGVRVNVERPTVIKASWFSPERCEMSITTLEGFEARAFQHEFDHLNGRMFTSYIKDKNLRFRTEAMR